MVPVMEAAAVHGSCLKTTSFLISRTSMQADVEAAKHVKVQKVMLQLVK